MSTLSETATKRGRMNAIALMSPKIADMGFGFELAAAYRYDPPAKMLSYVALQTIWKLYAEHVPNQETS